MKMQNIGRASLCGVVAMALGAGLIVGKAQAQSAAQTAAVRQPLPIADYLRPDQYAMVRLSPDGKKLATVAPVGGRRNLVVMDVATMKVLQHSSFTAYDVMEFVWVNDEWLMFRQGYLDTPTGPEAGDAGGEFVTKFDGSRLVTLAPNVRDQQRSGQYRWRGMRYVMPAKEKNQIIVLSNMRNGDGDLMSGEGLDVVRLNLDNNERVLLTPQHPGDVAQWVLDQDGVPRVAVVRPKDEMKLPPKEQLTRVLFRESLEAPWRELAKFQRGEAAGKRWDPVAFAENNQDLIVNFDGERDTTAVYRFDTTKAELAGQIAGHPRYDLSISEGLVNFGHEATLVRVNRKVVGLRFFDETVQTAYFDEALARRQAMLEKSFPGKAVLVQDTTSGLALVTVRSDRSAPVFYLFDQERKSMRELLRASETRDERNLVAMRPFLLKTRDGLEIPSYYFLPANYKPGQKLPVVVHIHGGPHIRADVWGTEGLGPQEAQVLASRGYAVVLPNFRITPGFGWKIYSAGYGEYGRKMSEDHEDAANWAVQQGFADPKRICISGVSYGGAAALWATIKSPDVFACAIAGAAPSDPQVQNTSAQTDYTGNEGAVSQWSRILGVKNGDWSKVAEVAPARHADQSRIPLFIFAGTDDQRVPIEQTNLMVDALKKAGKPPEVLMIKTGEGHGFGQLDNRVELYNAMLKFLDRHIGVGPTPGSGAASETPPAAAAK